MEGVVTEKISKDGTTLTVQLPGFFCFFVFGLHENPCLLYAPNFCVLTLFVFKMNHYLVPAAQGETSVVRAWDLRPSLIWNDGEWIEWSNLQEHDSASHEVLSLDVLMLDVCPIVTKNIYLSFSCTKLQIWCSG